MATQLEASFDRLSETVLRMKAERDALLAACQRAYEELDERYDIDQDGERLKEYPFSGAGELMRVLKSAIDKASA